MIDDATKEMADFVVLLTSGGIKLYTLKFIWH